jgi:hypothetical protein
LPLAVAYYLCWLHDDHYLEHAIAELDEADPCWRLEDIEASREQIPPAHNAALVVMALPEDFLAAWAPKVYDVLGDAPPPELLTAKQTRALREALVRLEPVLGQAQKLRHFDKGRFPIQWPENGLGPSLHPQGKAREAAGLLTFVALLRCQDGEISKAWDACYTAFKACKCLGDEPSLGALLMRFGIRGIAVSHIERTLAQGQVSLDALAETQRLLEAEAGANFLTGAIRGERALLHRTFLSLEAGQTKPDELVGWVIAKSDFESWKRDLAQQSPARFFRGSHAETLRLMTQLAGIAKQPIEQREAALAQWEKTVANGPEVVKAALHGFQHIFRHDSAGQARLRCAVAGLAVEAYRCRHGAWPKDLKGLVTSGRLANVPLDPHDGQALRFRPTQDGVVIFSVGPTGNGRGDAWDQKDPEPFAHAHEFRLWNVDRRRQQPTLRPPRE